jgi:hypothetical protein
MKVEKIVKAILEAIFIQFTDQKSTLEDSTSHTQIIKATDFAA